VRSYLYSLITLSLMAAAALIAAAHHSQAQARLQDAIVCWVPDFELPLPCDDEDDED
jgi:hypothetical protein